MLLVEQVIGRAVAIGDSNPELKNRESVNFQLPVLLGDNMKNASGQATGTTGDHAVMFGIGILSQGKNNGITFDEYFLCSISGDDFVYRNKKVAAEVGRGIKIEFGQFLGDFGRTANIGLDNDMRLNFSLSVCNFLRQ